MLDRALLENPNLRALLAVIRLGEGTTGANGYRTMFGGQLFDSFDDHPRRAFMSKWGWTSAAGAYQAMCAVPGKVTTDTWGDFVRATGAPDFTPPTQDSFALWGISRRGALRDILAGDFDTAVRKCALEWASLPGSPYGQPTITLERARRAYLEAGGTFKPAGSPAPASDFASAEDAARINAAVDEVNLKLNRKD